MYIESYFLMFIHGSEQHFYQDLKTYEILFPELLDKWIQGTLSYQRHLGKAVVGSSILS